MPGTEFPSIRTGPVGVMATSHPITGLRVNPPVWTRWISPRVSCQNGSRNPAMRAPVAGCVESNRTPAANAHRFAQLPRLQVHRAGDAALREVVDRTTGGGGTVDGQHEIEATPAVEDGQYPDRGERRTEQRLECRMVPQTGLDDQVAATGRGLHRAEHACRVERLTVFRQVAPLTLPGPSGGTRALGAVDRFGEQILFRKRRPAGRPGDRTVAAHVAMEPAHMTPSSAHRCSNLPLDSARTSRPPIERQSAAWCMSDRTNGASPRRSGR